MHNCPKCGHTADALQCGHCGYTERDSASDLDRLTIEINGVKLSVSRCSNVERGLRCAEPGTLTENTHGDKDGRSHPGPWFCHKHFPLFAGRSYGIKPTEPPQGFRALKDLIKNSGLTSEKP